MIPEMNHDGQNLYKSSNLNAQGRMVGYQLLKDASANHSDDGLANEIARQRLLNPHYLRQERPAATPNDTHTKLAEGEFNHFFMRGICVKAIQLGAPAVVCYRAKASLNPRPEPIASIGEKLAPQELLDRLRSAIGADTPLASR